MLAEDLEEFEGYVQEAVKVPLEQHEFDALVAEANSIADADTRRAVMAKIEQIMRDEGVIIQPYWRALYNHHVAGLIGVEKHPSNEFHYYKMAKTA